LFFFFCCLWVQAGAITKFWQRGSLLLFFSVFLLVLGCHH
jgi:hypothetical protein